MVKEGGELEESGGFRAELLEAHRPGSICCRRIIIISMGHFTINLATRDRLLLQHRKVTADVVARGRNACGGLNEKEREMA